MSAAGISVVCDPTNFSALERRASLGMGLATRDQLIEVLGLLPAALRRALTWDRGSEMAMHAEMTAVIGTLVYFCEPATRGGVHRPGNSLQKG